MSINPNRHHPPARPSLETGGPRNHAPTRKAFSLIELLVVLGLLIILSTIGVAAFSGTRKVSRLVGTEQLITGMIRQARMTARATGQAVMLYVDPDTRSISGVSRLAMWQSDCENFPDSRFIGTFPDTQFKNSFGRTGSGISLAPDTIQFPIATLYAGTGGQGRNTQLTRRPDPKPTEGFQLGAVVKALMVYDPSLGVLAAGPDYLPLLSVSDQPTASPDTQTSYTGLVLHRAKEPMFDANAPTGNGAPVLYPDPTNSNIWNPDRWVWEVVGWILPQGTAGGPPSAPIFISSIQDAVDPTNDQLLADGKKAKQRDPSIGGTWMEISMIFTATSLELFRDGRLIARKDLGTPQRLAGYGQPHYLTIGAATIGSGLVSAVGSPGAAGPVRASRILTFPAGRPDEFQHTIFDDIQLVRLGVDQPQVLPGGVVPEKIFRILIHPNGRITNFPSSTGDITWTFTGVFDEIEDKANITINPTSGTVTTTNVSLSASAP